MIFEELQIISLGLNSQVKGGKQQNVNTQVSSYFHGNSSFFVGARLQHERKKKTNSFSCSAALVGGMMGNFQQSEQEGEQSFWCVSDGRPSGTTAPR